MKTMCNSAGYMNTTITITVMWMLPSLQQGYVTTSTTVAKIYEDHNPLCSYEITTPNTVTVM